MEKISSQLKEPSPIFPIFFLTFGDLSITREGSECYSHSMYMLWNYKILPCSLLPVAVISSGWPENSLPSSAIGAWPPTCRLGFWGSFRLQFEALMDCEPGRAECIGVPRLLPPPLTLSWLAVGKKEARILSVMKGFGKSVQFWVSRSQKCVFQCVWGYSKHTSLTAWQMSVKHTFKCDSFIGNGS